MVVSAALLIRERGAHPTAIADVLAHSGAPRGSAYHYFPGGRTQLLCEAIDYAGEYVAAKIAKADYRRRRTRQTRSGITESNCRIAIFAPVAPSSLSLSKRATRPNRISPTR